MDKTKSGLTPDDRIAIASEVVVTGPKPTDNELNTQDKSLGELSDMLKAHDEKETEDE